MDALGWPWSPRQGYFCSRAQLPICAAFHWEPRNRLLAGGEHPGLEVASGLTTLMWMMMAQEV